MKIDPHCFPCALRRVLSSASRITDDTWLLHKLLDNAMGELTGVERDMSPAELIHQVSAIVSKTLGAADPFQRERDEWFTELEGLKETLEKRVAEAPDRLEAALLLSARSNVFDDEQLSMNAIRSELGGRGGEERFLASDLDLFRKDLEGVRRLLFVHDSGPELPYDRLLIQELHREKPDLEVICVVRSENILLDATREDLKICGILDLPAVSAAIDPGIATLGIPLNECSREFREVFEASDLVLAKGQASFETLIEDPNKVYFLFRVKCEVMARAQGAEIGDLIFIRP